MEKNGKINKKINISYSQKLKFFDLKNVSKDVFDEELKRK